MADNTLIDKDFGTVTKKVSKATPGSVFHIRCANVNAALRYLQLHDKATAPAATEVPILSIEIPAGTAAAPGIANVDFGENPIRCENGVSWAISTAKGVFTDSATASEHNTTVRYK